MLIVFIHRVLARCPIPLSLVNLIQLDFLQMDVRRELLDGLARRERLPEKGDDVGVDVIGEFDGYLDEEITWFMVSL